jgi:predicted negative regulator of RcsB-dependent stress response
MHSIAAGLVLFGISSGGFAQSRPAKDEKASGPPSIVESLRLERREKAAQAIEELSGSSGAALLAGADAIEGVNADTPAHRMDLAQRLLRLGLALKKEGEDELAEQAASAALTHLNAAESMINPIAAPEASAQALEMKGLVHERVRNDPASARANYQAAKDRDPNSTAARRLNQLNAVSGIPATPPGKGGTPPGKG